MEYDEDKVDEMTLALLFLVLWTEHHDMWMAWKGFDWDTLYRLHQKGLTSNSKGKARPYCDDARRNT